MGNVYGEILDQWRVLTREKGIDIGICRCWIPVEGKTWWGRSSAILFCRCSPSPAGVPAEAGGKKHNSAERTKRARRIA